MAFWPNFVWPNAIWTNISLIINDPYVTILMKICLLRKDPKSELMPHSPNSWTNKGFCLFRKFGQTAFGQKGYITISPLKMLTILNGPPCILVSRIGREPLKGIPDHINVVSILKINTYNLLWNAEIP